MSPPRPHVDRALRHQTLRISHMLDVVMKLLYAGPYRHQVSLYCVAPQLWARGGPQEVLTEPHNRHVDSHVLYGRCGWILRRLASGLFVRTSTGHRRTVNRFTTEATVHRCVVVALHTSNLDNEFCVLRFPEIQHYRKIHRINANCVLIFCNVTFLLRFRFHQSLRTCVPSYVRAPIEGRGAVAQELKAETPTAH